MYTAEEKHAQLILDLLRTAEKPEEVFKHVLRGFYPDMASWKAARHVRKAARAIAKAVDTLSKPQAK